MNNLTRTFEKEKREEDNQNELMEINYSIFEVNVKEVRPWWTREVIAEKWPDEIYYYEHLRLLSCIINEHQFLRAECVSLIRRQGLFEWSKRAAYMCCARKKSISWLAVAGEPHPVLIFFCLGVCLSHYLVDIDLAHMIYYQWSSEVTNRVFL